MHLKPKNPFKKKSDKFHKKMTHNEAANYKRALDISMNALKAKSPLKLRPIEHKSKL